MNIRRLIVAISGSSGAILGIRLLEMLKPTPIETHLILTPAARLTIQQETGWKVGDVLALADAVYDYRDIGAAIASGSYDVQAMVVIPCSIKSLSAIANSYAGDLLTRAADVTLKEGRPLVLVVRETPLHPGHIRLMRLASQAGAILFPPVPAFYAQPRSLDDVVDQIAGRVLARLGVENDHYRVWEGLDRQDEPGECWPPADLLALPSLTLATTGQDGVPHAAALYFAADEENRLYFFSGSHSQHGQDLSANGQVAVTIQPMVRGWMEIRGLQMRGTVRPVAEGEEWQKAWQLYQGKFPFVAGLAEEVGSNRMYVFTPQWVRLVDNSKGFGFKEERKAEG